MQTFGRIPYRGQAADSMQGLRLDSMHATGGVIGNGGDGTESAVARKQRRLPPDAVL